jgi:hypothetical protein
MSTKDKAPAPTDAPAPGTAVMTWKEKMALVTAQAAASEAPKGGWLSFKGGNMIYDENQIPGNSMDVIVTDFALENAYYAEKYNPAKTSPPICYAMGRDEASMVPHEDCAAPQNAKCGIAGEEGCCPHNEWGSDPEGGRGKACKNGRRVAIIPADVLQKGPEEIKKTSAILCKIPVTSIKLFSQFINQVTKVLEVPPFGVITRLSTKPHPANLFSVNWAVMERVVGDDNLQALYEKHLATTKQVFSPYPKAEEEQAAPAKGGKSKF